MDFKTFAGGLFDDFDENASSEEIAERFREIKKYSHELLQMLQHTADLWDSGKATDEEIKAEVKKCIKFTKDNTLGDLGQSAESELGV